MFDSTRYGCQGTVYDPFHSLEYLGRCAVSGPDSGFIAEARDLGDKYLLEAELPGYSKNELEVSVNDSFLTISACKSAEACVSRGFNVSNVDTDAIRASFSDELLTLELPKKSSARRVSRKLEIE